MRRRLGAAIGSILLISSGLGCAGEFNAPSHYGRDHSTAPVQLAQISKPPPPSFSDIVQFVQERGWQVDLGRICTEFDLPDPAGQCIFKQVSVQEIEGRGDPRGFNVPTSGTPYVLVFHLSPLVGEFFVVSLDGALIKAFYRAKGTGYSQLPNDEVREEFKADLSYWFNNLARLKQGVEAQQPQQK